MFYTKLALLTSVIMHPPLLLERVLVFWTPLISGSSADIPSTNAMISGLLLRPEKKSQERSLSFIDFNGNQIHKQSFTHTHVIPKRYFKESEGAFTHLPRLVGLNRTRVGLNLLVRFVWTGVNAVIALGCAPKVDQTSVPP